MKLITNLFKGKYFFLCLFFAVAFQTSNASFANNHKKPNEVVDQEFLKNINAIKTRMIEEGSEFKKISLKFISKTNRFVIADENIKVKNLLI